ncbi:MAG: NAD(P)H-hydrate dehydratase [Rhizobiales bacterium]|nr:NAD(P)H-hydrate dehydratase [Hyphomicrobiales bacterium]
MYRADALAVERGVASLKLMENAGAAVAREIVKRYKKCKVAVLCGPGNNGGDGFVVARLLKTKGWPVSLYLLGEKEALKGDAAAMARKWKGAVRPVGDFGKPGLIVDALFGAGLSRDFPEELAARINGAGAPIAAVDVPSGLDGLTGRPRGASVRADLTITFFRKKPAHVIHPGRNFCGEIVVAEIGIPHGVLQETGWTASENTEPVLPPLETGTHKYRRGAALIWSGGEFATGAARLAALAAARVGAGVVSIAGSTEALRIHAAHLSSIMLRPAGDLRGLMHLLGDDRLRAFCIGPAAAANEHTRRLVQATLETPNTFAIVFDADALTAFQSQPSLLFDGIKQRPCVMTPHEGEFTRLFPDLVKTGVNKIERTKEAAKRSGAVVLFKGPDTVIAAPDGRAIVNTNGSPKLATAGSGDVLAGIITGLIAQGLEAFEAAAAGAWLHADAANRNPRRTLIAEDLIEAIGL